MPVVPSNITLIGGAYLDLTQGELRNARLQNLATAPTGPVDGQVYYNSSTHAFYVYNSGTTSWVAFYPNTTTLDAITAPAADLSLNSHKITNLATPTASADAATKGYVDTAIQGISWKNPVRVATTAAGTLATSFANGQTVDGQVLATGDRVLIKNQATQSENGIYTVNASGAPTRSTDANTSGELTSAAVIVEQGTANAGLGFVQTTINPTIGSSNIVFVQFTSVVGYTFTSGVQLSGSTVSANVDGTTITVNGSNQLTLVAGTVPKRYTTTITGNGSTAAFTVTHNLNNADVATAVRATSGTYNNQYVVVDVAYSSVNAITLTFATAPTSGATYNVTVVG